MATVKLTPTIPAGATNFPVNLGPLGAPVGTQGGVARLFASQAVAGEAFITLSAGSKSPIAGAEPNVRAVGVVSRDQDGIGTVPALPLTAFQLTVTNANGGAGITPSILLDVEGVPGT